eukprot:g4283.t1
MSGLVNRIRRASYTGSGQDSNVQHAGYAATAKNMIVRNIGKTIKSSKKEIMWHVGLCSTDYQIKLHDSVLSNKKKIFVNDRCIFESTQLPGWSHRFLLDQFQCIISQNDVAENSKPPYELIINNVPYSQLRRGSVFEAGSAPPPPPPGAMAKALAAEEAAREEGASQEQENIIAGDDGVASSAKDSTSQASTAEKQGGAPRRRKSKGKKKTASGSSARRGSVKDFDPFATDDGATVEEQESSLMNFDTAFEDSSPAQGALQTTGAPLDVLGTTGQSFGAPAMQPIQQRHMMQQPAQGNVNSNSGMQQPSNPFDLM